MGVVSTVICCSLFIAVLVIKGDAQSFSCDSNITQPLCPGTITKCTCAITGAITQWSFTTLNLCPNISNIITLAQIAPCSLSSPSSSGTCGAYLSAINSPTQANSACPLSTLTITASQSLNGLTIECRDATFGPGTLIGTRNITITAPPSTPTITSLISTYSDQLTVTWTSVPTATSYNVSINASVNTLVPIPSTGAPQYTFTGLTDNTVYTVSVVAINCAGSSSPATITTRTKQFDVITSSPSSTVPTATNVPNTTNVPTVQSSTSSSNDVAIAVGVVVGFVVLLLVVAIAAVVVVLLVTKKGSPATPKGDNYEQNEIPLPPKNTDKAPSKPEGLIYADIGLSSRVPMQAPNPRDLSSVTYSTVGTVKELL